MSENTTKSNKNSTNRRHFVKGTGLAAAGWTIVRPESVYGTPANSKVKVGLLGCGRRGSRVSQLFVKHDQAQVSALADIYDDRIEAARGIVPAKEAQAYKSAQAILDADIDAIYIATPPYLHPEHFELAVASGKHILMEKPAAVDPAGVRRIIAAAKNVKPGQMVMVDFQQRWGVDYRRAYDMVVGGEIGEIRMIRSAWLGGRAPDPLRARSLRRESAQLAVLQGALRRHHRGAELPQHRRRQLVHRHSSGDGDGLRGPRCA